MLNEIKLVGSIVGTRVDLTKVFELHATGRTKVIYETRILEEVSDAFEEVAETLSRLQLEEKRAAEAVGATQKKL